MSQTPCPECGRPVTPFSGHLWPERTQARCPHCGADLFVVDRISRQPGDCLREAVRRWLAVAVLATLFHAGYLLVSLFSLCRISLASCRRQFVDGFLALDPMLVAAGALGIFGLLFAVSLALGVTRRDLHGPRHHHRVE